MSNLVIFGSTWLNVWLAEFIVLLVFVYLLWNMLTRKGRVIYFKRESSAGGNGLIWLSTSFLLLHELVGWRFCLVSVPPMIIKFGWALTVAGLALNKWSFSEMKAYMTPPTSIPDSQEAMLVVTGPYAAVRHPVYLSYLLVFLGLQLVAASPFVLFVPLLLRTFQRWAIREEEIMTLLFEKAYLAYRERTFRGI